MNTPPDDCIILFRGVVDGRYFDGVGFDHTLFSSDLHDIEGLSDWVGTSINWDLNTGGALEQLLFMRDERKGNSIKFKFGAIRIPREEVDKLMSRYKNQLAYEIKPENGNEYHGHILIGKAVDKARRQTICAYLANTFTEIHKQNNSENN